MIEEVEPDKLYHVIVKAKYPSSVDNDMMELEFVELDTVFVVSVESKLR